MPTVELNGRTAPGLVNPSGKEITYWSTEQPGFGLRCRASGARAWIVQYRTKAGELRKHTLGDPEAVTFAKASKEAGRLLARAKLGGDPAAEARKIKVDTTVRELVTVYLAHQKPQMKPRSYAEVERHLQKHLKPLHGQKVGNVTQRVIVEILQKLANSGAARQPETRHAAPTADTAGEDAQRPRRKGGPVAANRVRASVSAMFTWGMKAGLLESNPVTATFKPAEEKPRERVMSDAELALVWNCTGGAADYDHIVRLLLLTGARREEIAGMAAAELTRHDDGTATWVLPSARSKNHLPHELVLPRMAADLLPAPRQDGQGHPRALLFGEGDGPFSGWSRCKERLDSRITKDNDGKPIAPWVLHDLRRTFVTRLNDLGVEPHIIEALVNHASGAAKAGVAGIYNRSAYASQKQAALARWCEHVSRLTVPDRKRPVNANAS